MTSMFSFGSSIVLSSNVKATFYLELVFEYVVMKGSKLVFLHVDI